MQDDEVITLTAIGGSKIRIVRSQIVAWSTSVSSNGNTEIFTLANPFYVMETVQHIDELFGVGMKNK